MGERRDFKFGMQVDYTVTFVRFLFFRSRIAFIKSNQIKFISKCKNSAHSKHVLHLGGTARRVALTAAQCYSFIYKYKKLTIRYYLSYFRYWERSIFSIAHLNKLKLLKSVLYNSLFKGHCVLFGDFYLLHFACYLHWFMNEQNNDLV